MKKIKGEFNLTGNCDVLELPVVELPILIGGALLLSAIY